MTEADWKEKYQHFQLLQQQIEQISQHVQLLNQQNEEVEISKNAIAEIGETKVDNEIMAPVANGIFIKTELKDNQNLLVNVGSGTVVQKTVPQVVELLEEQKKQITSRIAEAEAVLEQLQQQAMQIYQDVQAVEAAK